MMNGRELLEYLGPVLAPVREIRNRPADDFEDVSVDELEIAARALRALGYSCTAGARRLEAIRSARCVLCSKREAAGGSDACEECIAEGDELARASS